MFYKTKRTYIILFLLFLLCWLGINYSVLEPLKNNYDLVNSFAGGLFNNRLQGSVLGIVFFIILYSRIPHIDLYALSRFSRSEYVWKLICVAGGESVIYVLLLIAVHTVMVLCFYYPVFSFWRYVVFISGCMFSMCSYYLVLSAVYIFFFVCSQNGVKTVLFSAIFCFLQIVLWLHDVLKITWCPMHALMDFDILFTRESLVYMSINIIKNIAFYIIVIMAGRCIFMRKDVIGHIEK